MYIKNQNQKTIKPQQPTMPKTNKQKTLHPDLKNHSF